MTGRELRESFLKYFERNGHTRVRSSSLVPGDDPTLLFTNAGMVQFKSVFLGEERRDYVRATTSQKCVRAGGKHNDLENVGYTARHHTFFEMLGNFSFGDYFKAEAIAYAWEFLTKNLALDQRRLVATVYRDDDDAFALWKRVAGLGDDRVLRLGEKDNFWAMGDTGPCGPCAEVHFHQGDHIACAEVAAGRRCLGPECECDRWLEVWNLVFMQFNRDASGMLTPLPRPSIDTGMGLERIASVVQGKASNWDTDLFANVFDRVEKLARKRYASSPEDDRVSMRVIADHSRTTAFLIADGVLPSNEWRGYVLRRIMRRAMRHARKLGIAGPFFWNAIEGVVADMGDAYPELKSEGDRIRKAVGEEEERFAAVLDAGMNRLAEYATAQGPGKGRPIDGRLLFTLYDTFGFPRDLAEDELHERGWITTAETDVSWESEMEAQRERARAGATFAVSEGGQGGALFATIPQTFGAQKFLGYDQLTAPAKVWAIVAEGATTRAREARQGETVEMILDQTPGYAESGGQIGDTGTIVGRAGRGEILDTYYRGPKVIVHRVRVADGLLREDDEVAVTVDSPRRQGLRQHHTGTHLLHAALRKVLGTHVTQAGSLVAPDHLRFDFSHGSAVKDREIAAIEELVNEQVQADTVVAPTEMNLDEALKTGAMALFGEKYGDRVRVIRIGDFSTELCGGTHLGRTGEIGLLKVTTEGAVASGVRRVEAVAGPAALATVARDQAALRQTADLLKIGPLEVPARVQKLLEELRAREKEKATLESKQASSKAEDLVKSARQVNGVSVIAGRLDGLDADALRSVADTLRDRLGSGVVCVGSVVEGKVNLIAAVTKDLTGRFQAGRLIQEVAKAVGGGGGGRPDIAQAGGKDPSRLDAALELAYAYVARSAA
jgi:alanyl-tRNA synthetase